MRSPAAMLCAGLMILTISGCSEPDLTRAEAEWADSSVLVIAQVNDVIVRGVLPGIAPEFDDFEEVGAVVLGGPLQPDWPRLADACSRLLSVLPGVESLIDAVPARFGGVATDLGRYHNLLAAFGTGCGKAAEDQDVVALEALGQLTAELTPLTEAIENGLPSSAACPSDVPDRPESCDVDLVALGHSGGVVSRRVADMFLADLL